MRWGGEPRTSYSPFTIHHSPPLTIAMPLPGVNSHEEPSASLKYSSLAARSRDARYAGRCLGAAQNDGGTHGQCWHGSTRELGSHDPAIAHESYDGTRHATHVRWRWENVRDGVRILWHGPL